MKNNKRPKKHQKLPPPLPESLDNLENDSKEEQDAETPLWKTNNKKENLAAQLQQWNNLVKEIFA